MGRPGAFAVRVDARAQAIQVLHGQQIADVGLRVCRREQEAGAHAPWHLLDAFLIRRAVRAVELGAEHAHGVEHWTAITRICSLGEERAGCLAQLLGVAVLHLGLDVARYRLALAKKLGSRLGCAVALDHALLDAVGNDFPGPTIQPPQPIGKLQAIRRHKATNEGERLGGNALLGCGRQTDLDATQRCHAQVGGIAQLAVEQDVALLRELLQRQIHLPQHILQVRQYDAATALAVRQDTRLDLAGGLLVQPHELLERLGVQVVHGLTGFGRGLADRRADRSGHH